MQSRGTKGLLSSLRINCADYVGFPPELLALVSNCSKIETINHCAWFNGYYFFSCKEQCFCQIVVTFLKHFHFKYFGWLNPFREHWILLTRFYLFLYQIVVTDLKHPRWKYFFPCGQWLAKDEGDGLIIRDLMGSTDPLAARKGKILE